MTRREAQKVARMFLAGASIRELSEQWGYTPAEIQQAIREWTERREEG